MSSKIIMQPTGKLYTSNVAGLKKTKNSASILAITRAGYEIQGTEIIRDLSPSEDLFHRYLSEWRNKMDNKEWWPLYEKQFLTELKMENRIQALREIYKKLLRGQDVVLMCYCKDHRYCHRRLVGEFFKEYGVEAEELNPVKVEQINLF